MIYSNSMDISVREPAVAGMFYPSSPSALQEMVRSFLTFSEDLPRDSGILPSALIVPHAGYIYSGSVAGRGYALFFGRERASSIREIAIFGPSHRVPILGCGLSRARFFETPLGKVSLSRRLNEALAELDTVEWNDAAHAREHSIEVHLPFIQTVFPEASISPVVVGECGVESMAEVVSVAFKRADLVVFSTDLSHYLPYSEALTVDTKTADLIVKKEYESLVEGCACGI
ncbi:MAG: AmmeMemoRadiSam system protein B, partial [Candidatus Dadabacteria bacterium]